MLDILRTESSYSGFEENNYNTTTSDISFPRGLGEASDPITAIANLLNSGVKLIADLNANGPLRAAQTRNGELQLVLDTYVEQNHQLNVQIAQSEVALNQANGIFSGLGVLNGWCIFNCKKKKAAAAKEVYLTKRIAEERTKQIQKVRSLQTIQGKMQAVLTRAKAIDNNPVLSQAAMGWGFGLLLLSLIGGYIYNEKKKKGKKPAKHTPSK